MVDWEKLIFTLAAIVVVKFIYAKWLDHSKDVHELYLQQQSNITSTRKSDESAIYSSNKLVSGLRGGLEIRYDHYKIRGGNLRDIWAIYMAQCKKTPSKCIKVGTSKISSGKLNATIKKLSSKLVSKNVKEVQIDKEDLFETVDSLALVLACFVGQITVHVNGCNYDDKNRSGVLRFDMGRLDGEEIGISKTDDFEFANTYRPEYDHGIPLKVSSRSGNVISETLFTQSNFASSVASFLKHLPEKYSMSDKDSIKIVTSGVSEVNSLVKLLGSFIAFSDINIVTSNFNLYDSTIVSIGEEEFLNEIKRDFTSISILKSFLLKRSLNLFANGVFSPVGLVNSSPRLIYISHEIGSKLKISLELLNVYRSLIGCRIILEQTYPNVCGPIIQTDFYDYRNFPLRNIKGYGCLSQSNEIKLVTHQSTGSYDGNHGEVYIRGYNIGKIEKQVIGLPNGPSLENTQKNEGFMPMGVKGRWGNDGCLYILE